MFLYWWRHGALSQFALEVEHAAVGDGWISAHRLVLMSNAGFTSCRNFGPVLFPVDTFQLETFVPFVSV